MILNEKRYADHEYDGLVKELLQSQDWDAELGHRYMDSVLILNPKLFLMLFRTVDKMQNASADTKDQNLIATLDRFRSKLFEYTNVIPADLPESIITDRNLIELYFTQHLNARLKPKWEEFQEYITNKADEAPKEFEIPFLKWCIQMLDLNLAQHDKNCHAPGCDTHNGFDRRIQFVKRLMEERTPAQPESAQIADNLPRSKKRPINKIQWLGTQKELAELFVELKKKGWIEKFENETIQDCFTETKSVPQYLKPATNPKSKVDTYENLYNNGHVPQFNNMRENPVRHK